jgi:hypothetical protein
VCLRVSVETDVTYLSVGIKRKHSVYETKSGSGC